MNWIQLIQTNSELILLLGIVSILPFFFLLTFPDSDNFERKYKFVETRMYWDTLLHCSCSSFQFYC